MDEAESSPNGSRTTGQRSRPRASRSSDVNLHWHDLRREYASRLVERGVPLAQIRDLLGHASIRTERYDNQKLESLQAAVLKLEPGKTFDWEGPAEAGRHDKPAEKGTDDRDKVSSFFNISESPDDGRSENRP